MRNTTSVIRDLWGEGRGWILLSVSFGWFFSLGSRLIYPVLLPQITTEFQIDYGTAGIVLSVLMIAYAIMNIPGGALADRIGERLVLVSGITIALVGIGIVIIAPSFSIFLIGTVLFGVGSGMFGTTGTTILSDTYPDHDTIAIGFSQAIGSIGTIVLPVVAGFIGIMLGWRIGVGYVLPGLLVLSIGLWIVVPERTSAQVSTGNESLWSTIRRVASVFVDYTLISIIVALACIGFVYQGLTGFLPMYLIEIKGFTQGEASLLFGLLFTGSIVGQLTSGPIADRYGKRKALIGFASAGAPAILVLPLVDNAMIIIGLVWISGLILGTGPIAMAYVIQFLPDEIQGSVFGIVRSLFIGIGVIAPPIVGLFADLGQFDIGIFVLGGVAAFTIVVGFLLPSMRE